MIRTIVAAFVLGTVFLSCAFAQQGPATPTASDHALRAFLAQPKVFTIAEQTLARFWKWRYCGLHPGWHLEEEQPPSPEIAEHSTARRICTLCDHGFDAVWLMGVWERSPAGIAIANQNKALLDDFRRALPDFRPEDNVGSPYGVRRYVVDAHLGGPEGLAVARRELSKRGLNLLLDFVPNHVAPDHPWVTDHPEYFIRGNANHIAPDPSSHMLDENEFFGPYGIRSISRFHLDHPFVFNLSGQEYRVQYLPAESNNGMFGGNSNWRGPVWMPVNGLLIRALLNLYQFYGDDFKVECPTGSGKYMSAVGKSSKVVMSWKNPAYVRTKPFSRVLALGLSDKAKIRADFEDALAAQLADTGVETIPGNTILLRPEGTHLDLQYLKTQVRENKLDAVVVSRLIKVVNTVTYVPGTAYVPPPLPYYGTFYGYYGAVYPMVYTPGYLKEEKKVRIETNLYVVSSGEGELVWTGITDTFNPTDVNKAIGRLVKLLVKQMRSDGAF